MRKSRAPESEYSIIYFIKLIVRNFYCDFKFSTTRIYCYVLRVEHEFLENATRFFLMSVDERILKTQFF